MLNIIELLLKQDNKSSVKELAKLLQASDRTIRYDIDEINLFLSKQKLGIINKNTKGHLELLTTKNIIYNFMSIFHDALTSEYKKIAIFIDIAIHGKINISHLCTQFKVSRPTIKSCLSEIKKELTANKLKLISNNKEGLSLIGEEADIRRLQLKLLNQYFSLAKESSFEKKHVTQLVMSAFEAEDVKVIARFIEEVTCSIGKVISDEAYSIIRNYLLILMGRIRKGHCLTFTGNQSFLLETDEFSAITKALPAIEKSYGVTVNSAEVFTLTDYFLGSHSYNCTMPLHQNWVEFDGLIKKIIDDISTELHVDLAADLFLFEGLSNHIKPAIHRVQNKIPLKNSIYSEVIAECPQLFELVKKSVFYIEEFIEMEISDEEIAFVTLHFKGAIDRHQTPQVSQSIKKILLVCSNGLGSSKLIEQQLYDLYNIDIVKSIPFHQFTKYWAEKTEQVDLLITTLSVNEFDISSPVLCVNTILSDQDIINLDTHSLTKHQKMISLSALLSSFKMGGTIQNEEIIVKQLKKELGKKLVDDRQIDVLSIFDMLLPSSIELNVAVSSWEEAIEKVGYILYDKGYVHLDYIDQMKETITKYGSYIVVSPNFALPHAGKERAIKTGMSLITLQEPVLFPGDISVSTLLAFSATTEQSYVEALYQFLGYVNSHNFVEKAHQATTPQDILSIIKQCENKR